MKKTTPAPTKKNIATPKVEDLKATRDPRGGKANTSDKIAKETMDFIKG